MTFQEFLDVAFSPVNTVLSVLLAMTVIYWLFTILTGLDIDIGIDSDLDADLDAPDGHVHLSDDPSMWLQFLKFLNLDIVPMAYFLTISLLISWLISFYLNFYLPLPTWLGVVILIPVLISSVLVTRIILKPLTPFFREINHKGEKAYDFLGRQGRLKSGIQGDKIGMMELFIGNDPMTLMVKSKGGKLLEHGAYVMIVDEEPHKRIYYVERIIQI
ncbi:hypothetical protein [uncultured Chryseobacterium sp.]|uniref:hypothetical protein n=1 Tax=uncultured Chryseobacterium sp. TaxID=259322 RepID=UPI0025FEC7CF|nr:hypothetical protein [uncultured Chryseobacterium sp.]